MWKIIIETMFSIGLFANAILFVPQIIRLYRTKDAEGSSLLTFGGFCLIQFFAILHGYINQDYLLMLGFALSLLTCGTVTILIVWYRLKK